VRRLQADLLKQMNIVDTPGALGMHSFWGLGLDLGWGLGLEGMKFDVGVGVPVEPLSASRLRNGSTSKRHTPATRSITSHHITSHHITSHHITSQHSSPAARANKNLCSGPNPHPPPPTHTTGTNVIVERQQRLTEEFVPRADMVLFVLSADRCVCCAALCCAVLRCALCCAVLCTVLCCVLRCAALRCAVYSQCPKPQASPAAQPTTQPPPSPQAPHRQRAHLPALHPPVAQEGGVCGEQGGPAGQPGGGGPAAGCAGGVKQGGALGVGVGT